MPRLAAPRTGVRCPETLAAPGTIAVPNRSIPMGRSVVDEPGPMSTTLPQHRQPEPSWFPADGVMGSRSVGQEAPADLVAPADPAPVAP